MKKKVFTYFKMPRLRLYQQMILCFALVIVIPLLGVTFILYNINQKALKKELEKFTEHTAETIYQDLATEMSWQQDQANLITTYLLGTDQNTPQFTQAATALFKVSPAYETVGIYDAQGHVLQTAYKNFTHLSPERRLPFQLPTLENTTPVNFEVLYVNTGDPRENSYYLRTRIKVSPKNKKQGAIRYVVLQRRFDYLQSLIRSHRKTLHEGLFIIDNTGVILAGPTLENSGEGLLEVLPHISPTDYQFFQSIPAGVTRAFTAPQATEEKTPLGWVNPPTADEEDSTTTKPLQKVFVKIPGIHWGIILESPYHVRQVYIKRARNQSLLLLVACLLGAIGLSLFYILGINRNFRQLTKAIKAMAEGNYRRKIRLITNSTTPYEIVYLTAEFNRMAKQMSDAWENSQAVNQKLAKLDEMKSNLIDTVSHELRTPLTNIKGYTSRLLRYEETLDSATRKKSLKVIKQQADRLSRLVEDLLVIPDLESSNLRVFPDQVDLRDLLERTIHLVQAEKEDRPVTITWHGELEAYPVLADPDRLEQVVVNLLDNALKYSHPETPIQVSIRPLVSATEMIEMVVTNQSDPIPEEELDLLFEKFKRLDERLTRTTRGSGLGLFITKSLVEAMGGNIALQYQESHFSVVVELPAYSPHEHPVLVTT